METDYLGSSSYQSELDSAVGGSNPISSWDGYLTSGFILTDASVEVSIYSPLQNNGWTYKLSCAQDCVTSGSNGVFFETFAEDNRHYTDRQILGINPDRNYDKYLQIWTKGIDNSNIKGYGLGLGEYSPGFPCLLGDKLYLFYQGEDNEGIHTWTLGSGQQTVSMNWVSSDGIDCPNSFYHDYDPMFSSNQFEASNEFCKDETINGSDYTCSSATITWSQAQLTYQVKSDGLGGCLEKFTVPNGAYNGSSCQTEPQFSFKIGCIDAAVIDLEEGQSTPPEENFPEPFRWTSKSSTQLISNTVDLYLPDYINEDRYVQCPCFNSTCCDGSTGACNKTTLAGCECSFGTAYSNSSYEEIISDPCAVYHFQKPLGYHPCTEGCESVTNAIESLSCVEINALCTGF